MKGEGSMNSFCYKEYTINIYEAPPYSFNSTDNKNYDKILKIETSNFNRCIELEISHNDTINTVLLIAPYHTSVDACAVVSADGLFLMLDKTVCIFDIETLEITKTNELDSLGTMFEVHPYDDDFILYGEMEIYRIDSDLNVVWQFSARDIFVRYQGVEHAFLMKKDRICLYDFLDNYYEIDYDGKLIEKQKI